MNKTKPIPLDLIIEYILAGYSIDKAAKKCGTSRSSIQKNTNEIEKQLIRQARSLKTDLFNNEQKVGIEPSLVTQMWRVRVKVELQADRRAEKKLIEAKEAAKIEADRVAKARAKYLREWDLKKYKVRVNSRSKSYLYKDFLANINKAQRQKMRKSGMINFVITCNHFIDDHLAYIHDPVTKEIKVYKEYYEAHAEMNILKKELIHWNNFTIKSRFLK